MAIRNTSAGLSPGGANRPTSALRRWLTVNRLLDNLSMLILGTVLVLLALLVPNFLTSRNVVNVFVQASTLSLMAIGMTFVMITGGIDLSIPAVMGLSAIFGAMVLRDSGNIAVAIVVMLVTGSLLGCINGLAVAYLKMIPFVVTLAMMTVAGGTAIWITNSVSVPITSDQFFSLILDRVLTIPRPIIFMVVAAIVAYVMVSRHIFGRWLYAVGVNLKAARVSRVPTNRVVFLSYVISGFCAGMTAVILAARLGSASANMGNDGVVLDVVSSAVVGGVSIYGGVGNPVGAVLGAIFIVVIGNAMNAMHVSFFTGLIVKGIVIITFVALDSLRRH